MPTGFDGLSDELCSAMQTLYDGGHKLPYTLAGVCRHGHAFVARFAVNDDETGVEVSFILDPTGDMASPINVMAVDSRGEAARIVLAPTPVSAH